MKKVLILLSFLLLPLLTFAEDNTSKVLKIESFKLNELTNTYEMAQYGSAILVDKNLIYTNAHVILNDKFEPIWNYRVCKTTDFKKLPECFSAWELLYYDIKNDLAVLKISDMETAIVTYSNKTLNIWDVVKVYWYPTNWGETISYTEWKISWFEKWLYKIDANIDAWNSWGWVFDVDWNLVWITVSVSEWYTTMWYIIPNSKITEFKNKINKWDIKTYDKALDSKFVTYNDLINWVYKNKKFDNLDISIKDFAKIWFHVSSYNIDNNNKFYNLELSDLEWNNFVSINNINYKLNDKSVLEYIESAYKNQSDLSVKSGDLKSYKMKKIKINWYNALLLFRLFEDKSVSITLRIEKSINSHLEISVDWYNWIKDRNFQKWLVLALKNLKIKDLIEEKEITKDYYSIDNLLMKKTDWFHIKTDLTWEMVSYSLWDIEVTGPSTTEYEKTDISNYTLSSLIKEMYFITKDSVYINNYQVNKTDNWINYIYIFWKNNQVKWKDVDKDKEKYFIGAVFIDIKDWKYYTNWFNFKFNNVESKITIDKLIETMKTTSWENILELWDIKLGENLIKSQEFDFPN